MVQIVYVILARGNAKNNEKSVYRYYLEYKEYWELVQGAAYVEKNWRVQILEIVNQKGSKIGQKACTCVDDCGEANWVYYIVKKAVLVLNLSWGVPV